jgi:hypothetical protein
MELTCHRFIDQFAIPLSRSLAAILAEEIEGGA